MEYLAPDIPQGRADSLEQTSVTTAAQLESAILDALDRGDSAIPFEGDDLWSAFTLWRVGDVENLGEQKGGRHVVGRLAVLRDAYMQQQ